jgi:hypothetical protein
MFDGVASGRLELVQRGQRIHGGLAHLVTALDQCGLVLCPDGGAGQHQAEGGGCQGGSALHGSDLSVVGRVRLHRVYVVVSIYGARGGPISGVFTGLAMP